MLDLVLPVTDPRPGIPGAPLDMTVNGPLEAVFTIVCGLPVALVLALALRGIVKDRNIVLPIFLLGGMLGIFVEPILDYMGGVWWPLYGGWDAFTLLGVNIPVLVILVYPWLLGGQGYLAYRAFEQGITRTRLWCLVGLFGLSDIVLETIGIAALGVYRYFGTQPLNFWGLPLWYVPCNAIGPVVAGALTHLLHRRLTGVRLLAVAPLLPMSFVGVYAAIGFPVWISLNSGWTMWAAVLAGLATFALGCLAVMVVEEATLRRSGSGPEGHIPQTDAAHA
jgi:hypothetical protein